MARLETLYELFPEQSKSAIDALAGDPEFQRQLPDLILDRVKSSSGRVLPIEDGMLPLFFSRAKFAETEEAYRVTNFFKKYFSHQTRFLPLAIDFLNNLEEKRKRNALTETTYKLEGQDFASRCLFSLAFFYPAMEKLYKKGAPHPEFYREMGKRTFDRVGQEAIASNFENWENFVRDEVFAA